MLWDRIRGVRTRVDAIGGLTIGAAPLVVGVSLLAQLDSQDLPGFIVRKEAKPYGRQRLIEGTVSLRQVYELIQDLSEFEATERLSLPFFVLRAILHDLAWRLEPIPLDPEVLVRVHQQLTPPIMRVLDAHARGNREETCAEMNRLSQQWALLKAELR